MDSAATAERITDILAQEELTLGTVECGVDGLVSRVLFDTPEGPGVIGSSLILEEIEQAIDLLELPRPQFRKAGSLSAKAARAAAREGRDFLQVDLCLAVWAHPSFDQEEQAQGALYIALAAGREVIDRTLDCTGSREEILAALVDQAVDLIYRTLITAG